MYIYVKLALYWNNFGPEKDLLGVLLLWLVLGGVSLPTDDELGGVPLNACQKKVFKLRAMQFGQNTHMIHTDTKKKTAGRCDFHEEWYWIFKIFSSQKFSVI
jgi:hypothetical protein